MTPYASQPVPISKVPLIRFANRFCWEVSSARSDTGCGWLR